MSSFVLLVTIVRLEYMIAKNTLIGGATVGIIFARNELIARAAAASYSSYLGFIVGYVGDNINCWICKII